MTEKKKLGRPRVSSDKKKDRHLNIYLSNDQYDMLLEKAEEMGLSIGIYARMVLLK